MNFDDLKLDVQRRLKRIERSVALDVLASRSQAAQRRRQRAVRRVSVPQYLGVGERLLVRLYEVGFTRARVDAVDNNLMTLQTAWHGKVRLTTVSFLLRLADGDVREDRA